MTVWHPHRPHNDLAPPPASDVLETRAVLKACIAARAALASLREATGRIANPAMLINTIPVLEAQASSEIENIVTTSDALFRYAEHGEAAADPATKEALRYRRALRLGFESLGRRPVSTSTAVLVCSEIKGTPMDVRRVPGTALANQATGEVIYTPPEGEQRIRDALAAWESFLHGRDDLDPLLRMAAGHYQFEAIHPFVDGNGRTGRVLNLLLLVQFELLDSPVLYLSRYVLRHRAEYYRRLLEVTSHGHWEEWLLFMLASVRETADWTTAKIHALVELHAAAATHVRLHAPAVYSHELVEVVFSHPYCRIADLIERGIAQRQTASRHLKELVAIGILDEYRSGREKVFVNRRLLTLLGDELNQVPAFGPFTSG